MTQRMTFSDSGIPFRSRLEGEIAEELDAHLVSWGYEMPVILPNGDSPRYLPDFTIHEASKELRLPAWVEGKPMQFIYDFRDSLGVTRKYGDRFATEILVDGVDSEKIRTMHIGELWKPKFLAEITGESVLVVGGVGGTSKLSVEMRPHSICFDRHHPFVNWPGHQKTLQREAERLRWAQNQVEWEAKRAELQREREETERRERPRRLAEILAYPRRGATRYDTFCVGCGAEVKAESGSLYKVSILGGGERWLVVCDPCRVSQT